MANKYTDAVHALRGLKPTPKAVLMALAHFADNQNGTCWPSVTSLGLRSGFGRTAVKDALAYLQACKAVSIVGQKPARNGAVNVYQINSVVLQPDWKPTRSDSDPAASQPGRLAAATRSGDGGDPVARRPQNSKENSSGNSSIAGLSDTVSVTGLPHTDTTPTKFGLVGNTALTWVAMTECIHSCTGMPYIKPVDPLLPLLVDLSEETLALMLQAPVYLYSDDNDDKGEEIKPGDPRYPGPDTSWPPENTDQERPTNPTLREHAVALTWTKFGFALEALEVLAQYLPLERPNSEVPEGMIEFREEDVLTMIRAYGWPSPGFLKGELGKLDLSLAYIAAVAQWAFKKSDYWPARLKTVQDFIKRFPTLQQQYDRYYANLPEGKKPHELGCGLPKE